VLCPPLACLLASGVVIRGRKKEKNKKLKIKICGNLWNLHQVFSVVSVFSAVNFSVISVFPVANGFPGSEF